MDPLLFGINADVVAEVFGAIVVLALVVERGLAILFEWRVFIERAAGKGLKEPIAYLVSLGVTYFYGFDALAARGRSTFSELRWYPPMEAAKGSLSWVFRAKQPESVRTGP